MGLFTIPLEAYARRMDDDRLLRWSQTALRLALGVTFLSAVADRFGLYGAPGATGVAWGDWPHFVAYAGILNWFLPPSLVPFVAGVATVLETAFGVALVAGYFTRLAALGSAALLTMFGLAMAIALDPSAPLDYSVFTAAAAALLLGVSTQAAIQTT